MRNGSKSDVSRKPKARRSFTPAPSMVGTDWLTRLTGRMDMSPPRSDGKRFGFRNTAAIPVLRLKKFGKFLIGTVLKAKIGIRSDRRKSINRGDNIYRSG